MKFTFAPEARPLPGYTIKRAIDRGGFGEVYFAVTDSGKQVALKLLQHNESVELRGVTQCLNLKHPNLVTIFDIRQDPDGDHWVVMEYMAGPSLEQVLADHPQGLPVAEVQAWLQGIAAGVAFLHDRGLVHRDLKPANVFRENGIVKIGDVGLSKFMTPSRRSAQTESVGTVYYMAPEVSRGKYGPEVDIYSLGVMLYEMLTGRVPFDGESTGEILMKHLTEAPDLAPLPPAYRDVVARALNKDPHQRYSSIAELAERFNRARHAESPDAALEIPAQAFEGEHPPQTRRSHGCQTGPCGFGNWTKAKWDDDWRQRAAGTGRGWPRTKWDFAAIAILLCVLFAMVEHRGPFRLHPLLFLGLFTGAVFYAVREMARARGALPSIPVPRTLPASPAAATAVAIPVRTAPAARSIERVAAPPPARAPNWRQYTPAMARTCTSEERFRGLVGSMFWAAAWTVLAAAAVGTLTPLFGEPSRADVFWGRAGLFGLTTLCASWSIIFTSKIWEGRAADAASKRLLMTVLGVGVGCAAWGFQQILLVDVPMESRFRGIVDHLGRQPFHEQGPTWVGYAVLFGALFGLRRWWWQADAYRSKRVKLSSVALSAVVGGLLPAAFAFPQAWSFYWALTLSCVLQLSSNWTPPEERLPAARLNGTGGA